MFLGISLCRFGGCGWLLGGGNVGAGRRRTLDVRNSCCRSVARMVVVTDSGGGANGGFLITSVLALLFLESKRRDSLCVGVVISAMLRTVSVIVIMILMS